MTSFLEAITSIHIFTWITGAGLLHFVTAAPTTIHVLLNKEDEHAAVSWIGLILFSPFLGSVFYWIFGINRIKRQARRRLPRPIGEQLTLTAPPRLTERIPKKWHALMNLGYAVHPAGYTIDNAISPLINGDEAYPEMLRAIDGAKTSIIFSSYIFAYDEAGSRFVKALGDAVQRGVHVRVLIDGIGIGYGWHRVDRALRRLKVTTARFLPTISLFGSRFINLRNHRKILSVDGEVAFVGGINIRAHNLVRESTGNVVLDIHFRVEGELINQINRVFAEDWVFATKEVLDLPSWHGGPVGTIASRVLPDGPDANYEKLRWALLGAINCAQDNIRIVTPYFIPDPTLVKVLQAASLRGVQVDIVVPGQSNILFFDWAMSANLPQLVRFGINIYRQPRPFDHSKLFLVDDIWSFIGSSNWDARSLELNFEINLECYDYGLNKRLAEIFDLKRGNAKAVTSAETTGTPLVIRLRNNMCRLLSPYL